MLEDETVPCPICDNEISAKVMRVGSYPTRTTYLISNDCPKCKTQANKIERLLNQKKRNKVKVERSYIKTDPRG